MATVTLYPVAIGNMDADSPDTILDITVGGFFATGHFSTPQTKRGLLWFDISSLGHDWTINSVTLKLTVNSNFLGTSHTINIYRLKRKAYKGGTSSTYRAASACSYNDYREDLTPDLAWTTAGAGDTTDDRDATAIGSVAVTSATSGTLSISLTTALVQAWVAGSFVNNGLILIADNEVDTTMMRWDSNADATPSHRPQLEIDYTPTDVDLLDDLEGYWKLDTAGYIDSSGHAHTLTPANTPTQIAGKIGNATNFAAASSEQLSSSDAALSPGNTDWTFTGWVRLTDKDADTHDIAGTLDSPVLNGWRLMYHGTGLDYFVFQIHDGGDYNPADTCIGDTIGFTGGSPDIATWYFVAVRHDSVRHFAHIFINDNAPDCAGSHWSGEEAGQYYYPYPGSPSAGADGFFIGSSAILGTFLNGDWDEVGYWSRWLSNDEILSLYNAGAGLTYPFGLSLPGGGARRILMSPFGNVQQGGI